MKLCLYIRMEPLRILIVNMSRKIWNDWNGKIEAIFRSRLFQYVPEISAKKTINMAARSLRQLKVLESVLKQE